MKIIPAIDIRNGKCVRLYQGDYNQQTIFYNNPVEVALKWQAQGAKWLHIVDLNGAATGNPTNMSIVEKITRIKDLRIELGGGLRQETAITGALSKGVKRVILSTLVINNPALVKNLCLNYGEAVVVALDARGDKVSIHGWQDDTIIDVFLFARQAMKLGVKRFIYTDIQRDGTLSEPNFDAIEQLIRTLNLPIIASGGISKLEHIRKLKTIGADAAIIGKALYTGDISLQEAILESGG